MNNLRGHMIDEIREKAQPYIDAGMDEAFAIAIAQGVDSERVIRLWEADWRKQYPDDDPLIRRILSPDNSLTIEDGEWLNGKRSDHERLVFACIDRVVEIDFAKALLEGGFDDHPDAVIDVLDGGEPELIARIRRLEGVQNLPPGIGFKVERKLSWDEEKKERRGWNVRASRKSELAQKQEEAIAVLNQRKETDAALVKANKKRTRNMPNPPKRNVFNPFARNDSMLHKPKETETVNVQMENYMNDLIDQGFPEETAREYAWQYFGHLSSGKTCPVCNSNHWADDDRTCKFCGHVYWN